MMSPGCCVGFPLVAAGLPSGALRRPHCGASPAAEPGVQARGLSSSGPHAPVHIQVQ